MITSLKPNEVFVFGSNERGIHGAGAALYAAANFGAIHGCGFGHFGQSFAIPTKDYRIKTLSLERIEDYVQMFKAYAHNHQEFLFRVTAIGCGLAGYSPRDVAPLFAWTEQYANVIREPEIYLLPL